MYFCILLFCNLAMHMCVIYLYVYRFLPEKKLKSLFPSTIQHYSIVMFSGMREVCSCSCTAMFMKAGMQLALVCAEIVLSAGI